MINASRALVALLALALGVLNCFFGYRIFRLVLAVTGFLVGALAAVALVGAENAGVAVVAAVIGGVIGAVVVSALYTLGVFLVGAAFGFALAGGLLSTVQADPGAVLLVGIIGAVIGGILALVLQQFFIIFSTSFGGAWAIIGAFLFVLDIGDPFGPVGGGSFGLNGPGLLTVGAIWLVVGVAGMIVQYRSDAREAERRG